MEYAVIESGGKQYRVEKGSIIEVDRLAFEVNADFMLDKVLLYVSDDSVEIGMPYISGMAVKAQILDHTKGEKVVVGKFRAKSRHRRLSGFRAEKTKIKIDGIEKTKSKK